MERKRITQRFPWLTPLRKRQRRFCFYLGMRMDRESYSRVQSGKRLPRLLFESRCPMYNTDTGFDMTYQENKVHNLKLAAAKLDGLLIRPGETFSFCLATRSADRKTPYKDGLVVVDGRLTTAYGGGLCQITNLLFWVFLHSPLTIVERHGHLVKDFPEPESDAPIGVDATVAEGWKDLKVKNETEQTFQISITFDETCIIGGLYVEKEPEFFWKVENGDVVYEKREGKTFEEADVIQKRISRFSGEEQEEKVMYRNRCEIRYELPKECSGREKYRVAVIFGGCSPEYGVSLESAYSVLCSMDKALFTPVMIGISRKGDWFYFQGDIEKIAEDTWCNEEDCIPAFLSPDRGRHRLIVREKEKMSDISVDVAFPVLHGKNGEDGTIQGLIELAGIPLAGCGTLASALCMDKDRAHRLVQAAGVRVPEALVVTRLEAKSPARLEAFVHKTGYPLFIKPVKAGSSYGVTKVCKQEQLAAAVSLAFQYDDEVIAEEAIEGFEVGCAVLGTRELLMGEVDEIELSGGFFDFTEKYTGKTSAIHVPARISAQKAAEIKAAAGTVYRALGCSGFARVDLFLTPEGEIVFNEVNTIPGFTQHSRYPGMMRAAGFSMEEILTKIIRLALEQGAGGRPTERGEKA